MHPLSENALKILNQRYFLKNEKGEVIENWEQASRRVSTYIAGAEKNKELREKWAQRFYNIISEGYFSPSSPIWFNAGTKNPQLNACFCIYVFDSMEDIFQGVKDSAIIYKTGGGCGFYFGFLRPKDSVVSGTGGVSSGPLSFMTVYDTTVDVIKQGAKRRGAALGCLLVSHPDIEEFIKCKNDKKLFKNFNISVGITDDFMRAVEHDEWFELKHPKDTRTKKVKAKKLWNMICKSAHKTGDPGLLFLDNINKFNPILGEENYIYGTNPCGEVPLQNGESCVLGSINLTKFVKDNNVDYKLLLKVVRTAVRFLDNTIDVNKYPAEFIEKSSKLNRKIGLGIMGYADMLIMLGMKYDSNDALKFADQLMNFINQEAYRASMKLGKEKGNFPNFPNSVFTSEKSKSHKKTKYLRNAARTTIAPTGSISIIADCSSGIEPNFAFIYERESVGDKVNLDWEHPLYKKALQENNGTLPKKLHPIFVTAHEIDSEWHIKTLHAFQTHVDNSVSKTVNTPKNTPVKEIRRIYQWAYTLGLKGITVFRDGCRGEQVIKHKNSKCPECGKYMLENIEGCFTCRACGYSVCSIK